MSEARERYPRCVATLERLIAAPSSSSSLPTSSSSASPFRVGPGVLRPPPARRSPPPSMTPTPSAEPGVAPEVSALIGELVDMVLVGADEAGSGRPEVHLQFKSDVIGGLHLRLEKADDGLHARFIVKDAATRRAVADHVDALVAHLRARGFAVKDARLEIA